MSLFHYGFTGAQRGMTGAQKDYLRKYLTECHLAVFHHGDCIGADAEAHAIAKELGLRVIVHPPLIAVKRAGCIGDEEREPLDYMKRNEAIVQECETLLVAPADHHEHLRSGTWSTVRYARKSRKLIRIIWPDGDAEVEAP